MDGYEMKKILLFISFLSTSNFIFAADRGEQKEQKEMTVQDAHDAILKNDVNGVARFLNQREENITAGMVGPAVEPNLFWEVLKNGQYYLAELFVMKGILDLPDNNVINSSSAIFIGLRNGTVSSVDNAIKLLNLLINNGMNLYYIYWSASFNEDVLEQYPELLNFLILKEKEIILCGLSLKIMEIEELISKFEGPVKKSIKHILAQILRTVRDKVSSSSFKSSQNIQEFFGELGKKYNVEELFNLLTEFRDQISDINESIQNTQKRQDKLFEAHSNFMNRYQKIELQF